MQPPIRPRCRRSPPLLTERRLVVAATLGAATLLVAVSVQSVWWTPLNVDEELTLRLAEFSFRHIFHIVSTERGGGPLHFWLEGLLQGWWPGLPALRGPSIVFAVLALPAVALVARELVGPVGAAGVVLLVAVSPILVLYVTFGRPHTLLFAWLLWGTVLALRAGRRADRRLWVLAGAALGLSVFVHPTAPLYALTAFAAAVLYVPRRPRELAREVWPGAAALVLGFLPYYVRTLGVLGDRYGLGTPKASGRTFTGRPVWVDAVHFVAPGRGVLNYFTVLALAGCTALVVRRRIRVLAFCAVSVLTPVLFFSVVPANGDSALFFDRYMIPAIPAFLTLVLAGCLAVGRWAGGARLLVVGLLVAGLLGIELRYVANRRGEQRGIGLAAVTRAVTRAVARAPAGAVLFGTTGTSGAFFSSFDYGHPANVLDRYLSLRVPSLTLVDDDSCQRALGFVTGPERPRTGLWVFYAASPEEAAAAARALRRPGVRVEEVGGHYFLARPAVALPPRALIALGRSLRVAWRGAVPANRRVNELLQADRQLLRNPPACRPYGQLGDPDISPHWPPVRGRQ